MSSAHEDLIGKIAATGISEEEAEHAARRCLMSMEKNGGFGYAGGATFAYFLAMSTTPPGAAVAVAYSAYAVVGGAIGAGYALAKSPQCSEVREAISFWNTAPP